MNTKSRPAHYWRHASTLNLPTLVCAVDTETKGRKSSGDTLGELHELLIGWACCYRIEKGKRTRERWHCFTKVHSFWGWLDEQLTPHRPLWLIGHNLAFDLGVLGAWQRFMRDDWLWLKYILDGGIFLMQGYHRNTKIILCDTFNYYKCSLKVIGKAVGMPKLDMPDRELPTSELSEYCKRDVQITCLGFDALIEYTRQNDLGPWGSTIASLAFNSFRKRFLSHDVLVSDNMDAIRLERDAYYGGLVATNYIGVCPSDNIYELDVNSMYPSVCLQRLPIRLVGYAENVAISEAKRLLESYHCFADCDIESHDRQYPYRENKQVIYPRGRYRASLPHPELVYALSSGDIRHIYRISWHERSPVFKQYMEYFSALKNGHESAGLDAFRTIDKYMMNALYGKTGQQSPRWVPMDDITITELSELHGIPESELRKHFPKNYTLRDFHETLTIQQYDLTLKLRDYFGYIEVDLGRYESRDSVPAIAAVVTSFARMKLRNYQAIAGPRDWFYSDTDSIWVSLKGLKRLMEAGEVRDNELGYLGLKAHARKLTIHGRKDYEAEIIADYKNGKWIDREETVTKLKGIKKNARKIGDATYEQLHFPKVIQQITSELDCGVLIKTAVKRLRRIVDWCQTTPSGWTMPLER